MLMGHRCEVSYSVCEGPSKRSALGRVENLYIPDPSPLFLPLCQPFHCHSFCLPDAQKDFFQKLQIDITWCKIIKTRNSQKL